MKLTPLDIKKQDFSTKLRGYDPDEVNAFLEMMALQWEEVLAEQRRSEEKVTELKAKLEHYERVEEALQEALQTARESSKHTLDNARQEAALIVKEAEGKAVALQHDARTARERLEREMHALTDRRDQLVARLRAFLTAEAELLEKYETGARLQSAPAHTAAAFPEPLPALDPTPAPEARTPEPAEPVADEPEMAEPVRAEAAEPRAEAPAIEEPEIEEPPVAEEPEIEEPPAEEPAVEEPPAEEPASQTAEVEAEDEAAPEMQPTLIVEVGEDFVADEPAASTPEPAPEATEEEEPLSFRFFEPAEPASVVPVSESLRPPVERGASRRADASWIVRPAVAAPHAHGREAEPDVPTSDDLEKIRRILNDFD